MHAAVMRVDLTIDASGRRRFDVALSGPTDMCLGQVLPQLRQMAAEQQEARVWVNGDLVTTTARIGREPVMPGAVLRLGTRATPPAARSSMLALRVIGGPDAGLVVDLPVGSKTIGRSADCDLVLTDADVSRRHVRVTTSHDMVLVEKLQPTNQTTIDDVPVRAPGTPLRIGQIMRLGDSFLTLAGPDEPPVHRDSCDGRILLTARGRRTMPNAPESFELPAPPEAPTRLTGAAAPVAIAIASGAAVALVVRSTQLLIISIAMPVAALGASFGEYLRRRRIARRRAQSYRDDLDKVESAIGSALQVEAASLRQRFPDVVSLQRIATARTSRLWERLPEDLDLLSVRVGTGDRHSQLNITCDGKHVSRVTRSVPVVVDLRAGPIEVTGPRTQVVKLATFLICQLAVLCSPADIEVLGVFTPATARRWLWLRWLPQLRRPPATSMTDQEQVAAHLVDVIGRRREHGSEAPRHRWLVLLVDVPGGDLHPGIGRALASADPGIRMTAIVVAAPRGGVHCPAAVDLRSETASRAIVRTSDGTTDAVADLMRTSTADLVARALAPLADGVVGTDSGGGFGRPLLSLLGLATDPSAADIAQRWEASDGQPSTTIGVADAGPVEIDLARDGPHGLIAGTTGSGKSECLQAIVAGLAASHAPDQVAFVLVDYKGGAAFSSCARLPHVAALVTDLDPLLTQRALRAFECELRRREMLFAQHGVAELDQYRRLAQPSPVPRLVIVVDEFAALAHDAPDLLRGLVGVAQRGRSLGVHLLLATQRPAGVVSADIRANASLRIALRVTDPSESLDVVGIDTAADIDPGLPGRAILNRAGVCAQVQMARVSGRSTRPAAPSAVRLGPWRVIPAEPRRAGVDNTQPDDLSVLVDAVVSAGQLTARPRAEPPWLPPLPTVLSTAALPQPERIDLLHIGLVDLPTERSQPPASVDLARGGTTVISGSARSGRTTAVRAIAIRAATQLAPDQLRIVAIGDELSELADLPHCSSVLDVADFAATATFLELLKAELPDRRRTASTYLLLVLDGWEQFTSASDDADLGRSVDTVLHIAREAHSTRCTVVIAGDRSALSPRLASTAQSVYVLRLSDRADYGLVGIPRSAVPVQMAPGRALLAPDGHQVQLALPADAAQPMCG